VTIKLSDGVVIKKTITLKGTDLSVKTADGIKVPKEQTYIKSLTSGMAFDPIAFVNSKPADRLKFLLEAMPIEFSTEDLLKALKDRTPRNPLNLEEFNGLLEGLIEERRGVNRDGKTLDGAIARLERALPEDSDTDWSAKQRETQGKIENLQSEIARAGADRDVWIADQKATAVAESSTKIEELRRQISEEETHLEIRKGGIERQALQIYNDSITDTQDELNRQSEYAATIAQKAEESTRAAVLREEIEINRQQAQDKQTASDELTLCIDRMRKLKQDILSDLPIPGVDIREGETYVDDTPWKHVNAAKKYMVAAQVSSLKDSILPFKVIDAAEQLENENFKALVDGYREAGLQLAVARLTADDELVVETAP
jgi:hypothetical protein